MSRWRIEIGVWLEHEGVFDETRPHFVVQSRLVLWGRLFVARVSHCEDCCENHPYCLCEDECAKSVNVEFEVTGEDPDDAHSADGEAEDRRYLHKSSLLQEVD